MKTRAMQTPKVDQRTRDLFVVVVGGVAARHRGELEDRKRVKAKDLARTDFVWLSLLQSFATMGGSRGWQGLIETPKNYAQVAFDVVAKVSEGKRRAHLEKVLRAAEVRWPAQKAAYLVSAHQQIVDGGGLAKVRKQLLSTPGREGKIAFLIRFPGIGPKYARNIMMDVFHPDFHDAIAVDSRIDRVLRIGGVKLTSYEDKEAFLVDVARRAALLPWELDRCLYWFTDDVIAGLGGASVPIVSAADLVDAALAHLDVSLSAKHRAAMRRAMDAATRQHRGSTIVE